MINDFHFRRLTSDDWQEFKNIEDNAFPHDGIDKEEFNRLVTIDGFIGYFKEKKREQLIGYLYLTLFDEYGHLNRIAIKKIFQGQGFGNVLMNYALDYFSRNNSKKIGIYVETNNETAISLYRKFGFIKQFESWHYIIDFSTFDQKRIDIENYELKEVKINDLKVLNKIFNNFDIVKLKKTLLDEMAQETPRLHFLGLTYDKKFVGFARFNPVFSGCMPFHYTELRHVDPFVELLKKFKKPEKDYIRITFDAYEELAQKFEKAGYKKHHHLFKLIKYIVDGHIE